MTAPFTDARMPEVLARVAVALVKRKYHQLGIINHTKGQIIMYCIRDANELGLADVRLYLSSMYYYCVTLRGVSSKWQQETIRRSRAGENFRSACFTDYKAGRRDPRVTNRGVGLRQASIEADETTPLCNVCQEVDCEC